MNEIVQYFPLGAKEVDSDETAIFFGGKSVRSTGENLGRDMVEFAEQRAPFELERVIRADELAAGYNHVHHADTFRLLEEGRLWYLEQIGFPNEKLLSEGIFLVITDTRVSFRRELFAETVRISCFEPVVSGKRLSLKQEIRKAPSKVAVSAEIEFCCMNGRTRRAMETPEALCKAFLRGI